jgi:hypothetical protein
VNDLFYIRIVPIAFNFTLTYAEQQDYGGSCLPDFNNLDEGGVM